MKPEQHDLPMAVQDNLPPPIVDLVAQVKKTWLGIDEKNGFVCLMVELKMADGVDRIVNMRFDPEFANRNAGLLMRGARKLKGVQNVQKTR
jgi:hypothetical protein